MKKKIKLTSLNEELMKIDSKLDTRITDVLELHGVRLDTKIRVQSCEDCGEYFPLVHLFRYVKGDKKTKNAPELCRECSNKRG